MAILEAEPQYKKREVQPLDDAAITPVDYRVLHSQLACALQENPAAAEELIGSLTLLNNQSPPEAISAYAELSLSQEAAIIDVVSNQLAGILTDGDLSPEDRQRAREIWRDLLHPIGSDGKREGNERAYVAQEVYNLVGGRLDEETRAQLDPEVWDEFREPSLSYLESFEGRWQAAQRQMIELERRARLNRKLGDEHALEFMMHEKARKIRRQTDKSRAKAQNRYR